MSVPAAETPTASLRAERLWTIDALRGVAALGVVMFHASDVPGMDRSGPIGWVLDGILTWGRYGVWLFFVLSGFCIHMRWASRAASGDRSVPGFVEFWKRRFRRLYPPYLIALLIFVAFRLAMGVEDVAKFGRDFVLHLLLIQNNVAGSSYAFNEVFWTLAIEEQLYLLYFVFLAVRIRYGWRAALLFGLGARVGWFALAFALRRTLGWELVVTQMAVVQWIIWILGALSVEIWFGLVRVPKLLHSAWIGSALLVAAAVASHYYMYVLPDGLPRDVLWLTSDLVWGAAFFVLLNASVGREARPAGWFGKWLAGVGLWSYSLYLTHELITHVPWRLRLGADVLAWIQHWPSVVLIPLLTIASMLLARAYFAWFERPFLSASRTRRVSQH